MKGDCFVEFGGDFNSNFEKLYCYFKKDECSFEIDLELFCEEIESKIFDILLLIGSYREE